MEEGASIWERVDLPVLEYVREFPFDHQWRFDRKGPTEELPHLSGEELDASLNRLANYGLISFGDRSETIGFFNYIRVRLAPDGLRVLGEWPPNQRAEVGTALVQILLQLSDAEPEVESTKSLRRAAGAVGRFSGDVIFDIASSEARSLGKDVGQ